LIALHSLRGGTGCSSLAVNLGVGLVSLWKKPTILLDLTMTAGQVALMLNMTLRRTWADLAHLSPADLEPEVLGSVVGVHDSGLSFVAAPTFPSQAQPLKNEFLAAAIGQFRNKYEYVLADLPHDFSESALPALDAADLILMVATPDMASIRAVTAALDTYEKLGYSREKTRLLLNATFPQAGLPKEKIEAALGVQAIAVIPYVQSVFVEAINRGVPPVHDRPQEGITGLLEDFALFISKDEHKKSRPENPTETWKRVYKRYQERKK
jgi:pilus assembly protein CpaE